MIASASKSSNVSTFKALSLTRAPYFVITWIGWRGTWIKCDRSCRVQSDESNYITAAAHAWIKDFLHVQSPKKILTRWEIPEIRTLTHWKYFSGTTDFWSVPSLEKMFRGLMFMYFWYAQYISLFFRASFQLYPLPCKEKSRRSFQNQYLAWIFQIVYQQRNAQFPILLIRIFRKIELDLRDKSRHLRTLLYKICRSSMRPSTRYSRVTSLSNSPHSFRYLFAIVWCWLNFSKLSIWRFTRKLFCPLYIFKA